jgi:hypothetical protein
VVASKRWHAFDFTLGLGWGRLGTGDDATNPLRYLSESFLTRERDVGQGGTAQPQTWFHGEATALFGGIEWSVPALPTPFGELDGLRAKIEWSGDALRDERGGYPATTEALRGRARSRLNVGLQWSNDWLDAGISYVNGSDVLVRLSARLDPAAPPRAPLPAPPDMAGRPAMGGQPAMPIGADAATAAEVMFQALREARLRPLAVEVAGAEAFVAVAGGPYRTLAQAAGRAVRAVQPLLPAEVERVTVSWWLNGVEVARLALLRAAVEDAAAGRGSAEEIFATALLLAPDGEFPPGATRASGLGLDWSLEPRLRIQVGDPTQTLRWEAYAAASARIELGAGFALGGALAQAIAGNLGDAPPSDSVLPRVRSDIGLYAREGTTAIPALYAERLWNLAPDWFARATIGYLEPMFAGVSAELLWRPRDSAFGIGLDVNWVRQRDYDMLFGLRGYEVATGHLSLHADLPWWNLYAVLRGGRYLAGDWGGTIEIGRRFDSGIEVGAFATFTDVPFSRFGEGSFDKGIYIRVPLDLFGVQSRTMLAAVVRPVQRDGGQRLAVDNALWDVTRDGREDAFTRGLGWVVR